MATDTERLAEVDAAISAVLQRGQRLTIADRELWRADLAALQAERKRLEPLAARERRGGGLRMRQAVPAW